MPYIAKSGFSNTTKAVGNGQCVKLVKALTGAPASSLWKEGKPITEALAAGELEHDPELRTIWFGRPGSGVAQRPELYSVVE